MTHIYSVFFKYYRILQYVILYAILKRKVHLNISRKCLVSNTQGDNIFRKILVYLQEGFMKQFESLRIV